MNFTNTVQAVLDGPDISLAARLELERRLAGGLSGIAAQARELAGIIGLRRWFGLRRRRAVVGCDRIRARSFAHWWRRFCWRGGQGLANLRAGMNMGGKAVNIVPAV